MQRPGVEPPAPDTAQPPPAPVPGGDVLPAVQEPPPGPPVNPRGFRVAGIQPDAAGFVRVRIVMGRELYENARRTAGALQLGLMLAGRGAVARSLNPALLPLDLATVLGESATQVVVEYRVPWDGRDSSGTTVTGPVTATGTAQVVSTEGPQPGVLADAGGFRVAPEPVRAVSRAVRPQSIVYVAGQPGALEVKLVASQSAFTGVQNDSAGGIVRAFRINNLTGQTRIIPGDTTWLRDTRMFAISADSESVGLAFSVPWDGNDDAGTPMGDVVTVQATFSLLRHDARQPILLGDITWKTRVRLAAQ